MAKNCFESGFGFYGPEKDKKKGYKNQFLGKLWTPPPGEKGSSEEN